MGYPGGVGIAHSSGILPPVLGPSRRVSVRLVAGSTLKTLDRIALRSRYALRSFLADPPGGKGSLGSRLLGLGQRAPTPARVVLDLGRCWNGKTLTTPRPLEHWQEVLLAAVDWLGPVPVTFLSRSHRLPEPLPEAVRFAHRLGCNVALYGVDGGIDDDLALRLVDLGLQRASLVLGGVTPDLHAEVSDRSVGRTTAAVASLVRAREQRQATLDVIVDFPCTPTTAKGLPAVMGWSRQAGADGFAVSAPFLAPSAPAHLDHELARRLGELESSADPFQRTPRGTTRALRSTWAAGDGGPGGLGPSACPVAGLRLDMRGCGRFGACPFHRSVGEFEPGVELAVAWAAGWEHFQAARECARRCWHPELIPAGRAPPWGVAH